jgi:hypothetical protein
VDLRQLLFQGTAVQSCAAMAGGDVDYVARVSKLQDSSLLLMSCLVWL